MENITLPHYLTTIEAAAFAYCKNLKNITIPDSVVNIGRRAFAGMTINNIKFPERLLSFKSAFEDCELDSIEISADLIKKFIKSYINNDCDIIIK